MTVLLLFCRFFINIESDAGLDSSPAARVVERRKLARAVFLFARAQFFWTRLDVELGEVLGISRSTRTLLQSLTVFLR